eukprot:UN08303
MIKTSLEVGVNDQTNLFCNFFKNASISANHKKCIRRVHRSKINVD